MALSKEQMAKKLATLVQPVAFDGVVADASDPDAGPVRNWAYWVALSHEVAVVVEVHKGWCGPSPIVLSVFQKWYLDIDEADSRVAFAGADPEGVAAVRDIKEVKANEKNCMPLFVVLRSGHIAGRVVGLNAPGLRDFLDLSMPELPGEGEAA
jgi:hypothetical protein